MYRKTKPFLIVLLILTGTTSATTNPLCLANSLQHRIGLSITVDNQSKNVTYEGDLLVANNYTFTIQNSEFYMIGTITVQDTSTLIIQNSKFTAMQTYEESIVLEDQASLIIDNTTMVSNSRYSFESKILVQDSAEANITYSKLQNQPRACWEILAYNNSIIHVKNSNQQIVIRGDAHDYNGIVTFGTSMAEIENSTIDGVFVSDNSRVTVKKSVVGRIRAEYKEPNEATVDIAHSEIESIHTSLGTPKFYIEDSTVTWRALFRSNSSARFTSSSVDELIAYSEAKILLIGSHAGSIETDGNAIVLVGWHLPLFGLVAMHYALVPIIQLAILIAIIAIVLTLLVLLRKKRSARNKLIT